MRLALKRSYLCHARCVFTFTENLFYSIARKIYVLKNAGKVTIVFIVAESWFWSTFGEDLVSGKNTASALGFAQKICLPPAIILEWGGFTGGIRMIGWDILYQKAKEKQNPRCLGKTVEAGGVSAAILTESGQIYCGVCIDTACSLGMCAERNAAANMITNGESRIVRLVCIMNDGSTGMPCGACREFLMQVDEKNAEMEILSDRETLRTVRLGELLPEWWIK